MDSFIAELDRKASEINSKGSSMSMTVRLMETAQILRASNPTEIYSHLIGCMVIEQQLIRQSQQQLNYNTADQMTQSIHQLAMNVSQNGDLIKQCVGLICINRCEGDEISQYICDMEVDSFNGEGHIFNEIVRTIDSR